VDNTTNTVANKGVSFFLLIASATGCTKQGLSHRVCLFATEVMQKKKSEDAY
jgi:hypothetical protein